MAIDQTAGTVSSGSPIPTPLTANAMAGAPIVSTPDAARANIAQAQGTLTQAKTDMATQAQTKATAQPNVSVVDYLASQGKPTDFASRSVLAKNAGIANYTGTAEQNTQLLGILQSTPTPTQAPTKTSEQQPQQGGGYVGGTKIPPGGQVPQGGAYSALISKNNNQPYTFTRDTSGAVTYFDYQGNALPGNPIGTQFSTPENTPGFGQIMIPKTTGNLTPGTTAQDIATTDFQNKMNNLNTKVDSSYTDFQNKISSIQNGTFPLTSSQQAQIDAIKEQFESLRASQLLANKNYEGGITALGITSGRSQYAPELEMGLIKEAIDSGIAQIADLNSKQAQTVAQLEDAFQTKNLDMIQKSYTAFQDYVKQKQDALTAIKTAVDAHEKDVRDFNYKTTQDTIDNVLKANAADLESAKFDQQKAQDLIKNQIDKANLSINERKQLLAEANQKLISSAIEKMSASTVPTTSDGKSILSIDSASRNAWIDKNVPTAYQEAVKGLLDYTKDPSGLSTRILPGQNMSERMLATTFAHKIDPSFSEAEYPARKSFIKNWKAGGQNSVIQSANTAIQHLGELKTYSDEMKNKSFPLFGKAYNTARQWANEQSGDPNIMKFKQTAYALAGEMAKIYKNGVGSNAAPTEVEITEQLNTMSSGLASGQIDGLIENGVGLMRDRLNSAIENYTSVMGKKPDTILYPSAKSKIDELQKKGLNIDISSLDSNPMSDISDEDLFKVSGGSQTSSSTQSVDFTSLLNLLPQQ